MAPPRAVGSGASRLAANRNGGTGAPRGRCRRRSRHRPGAGRPRILRFAGGRAAARDESRRAGGARAGHPRDQRAVDGGGARGAALSLRDAHAAAGGRRGRGAARGAAAGRRVAGLADLRRPARGPARDAGRPGALAGTRGGACPGSVRRDRSGLLRAPLRRHGRVGSSRSGREGARRRLRGPRRGLLAGSHGSGPARAGGGAHRGDRARRGGRGAGGAALRPRAGGPPGGSRGGLDRSVRRDPLRRRARAPRGPLRSADAGPRVAQARGRRDRVRAQRGALVDHRRPAARPVRLRSLLAALGDARSPLHAPHA